MRYSSDNYHSLAEERTRQVRFAKVDTGAHRWSLQTVDAKTYLNYQSLQQLEYSSQRQMLPEPSEARISLATPNAEALSLLASSHSAAPAGPPSWKRSQVRGPKITIKGIFSQYGRTMFVIATLAILSFLLQVRIEFGVFQDTQDRPHGGIEVADISNETILDDTTWRGYDHYLKRMELLTVESVKESQHLKVTGRGPYGFAQFSSYRVDSHSFAAVGFGARKLRKAALESLKNCWWEGQDNKSIPGTPDLLYSEEKDQSAYDSIILMCTLKEDTGDTGGRGMVTIDSEIIVTYREARGGKGTIVPPKPEHMEHSFTVCTPSVSEAVEARMVTEFIEYHRVLGVDHFVMYDAGAFSRDLAGKLDRYLGTSLLEVVPFRGISKFEILKEGALLALHDCLYRSRYTSRWVVVSDWDEYLFLPSQTKLTAILRDFTTVPWVSHGAQVWSSRMCRQGPPLTGGDHWVHNKVLPFATERMVFRWPHVVCHGSPAGVDPNLCLGGAGERRYIVNPRSVGTLHMYEVGSSMDGGKDLDFRALNHQRFPGVHLRRNFSEACSDVYRLEDKVDWWVRDESQAMYARQLRESEL